MTLQRSLSTDYNQNDLNLQNLTPYEQLNHLLGKILVTADIRFLCMLIMCIPRIIQPELLIPT